MATTKGKRKAVNGDTAERAIRECLSRESKTYGADCRTLALAIGEPFQKTYHRLRLLVKCGVIEKVDCGSFWTYRMKILN